MQIHDIIHLREVLFEYHFATNILYFLITCKVFYTCLLLSVYMKILYV